MQEEDMQRDRNTHTHIPTDREAILTYSQACGIQTCSNAAQRKTERQTDMPTGKQKDEC
jgi:hypothetical protein